jgi:signal transduction histidine kinase
MTAAHRVAAWIIGSAALFACEIFNAIHQRIPLSAAGITIAAVTYVIFTVIFIMRWPPWLAVTVTTAGAAASMPTGPGDSLIGAALVVSLFVFSLRSDRTPAITGTAAVIGVLVIGHLAFALPAKRGWSDLAVVPWTAVASALGQAVRGKRAHQAMLEERARRAEEAREHEARRRISEERLRIARELHDAVGHHVALISVQAGAMGYLLDTDLDRARESLAHIQRASESALEELRLTVGLLRQPGEVEPTEPAGGLGRLDELIESFTATGLRVTCDVTGQVRPLPEAVDLTAYRVIQESLTNTTKHAAGASAVVRLVFGPGVLALAVEDDGCADPGGRPPEAPRSSFWGDPSPQTPLGRNAIPPDPPGEGHGIIGMRERAATVGGWLTAGPRGGGGFRVLAELPAPASASASAGAASAGAGADSAPAGAASAGAASAGAASAGAAPTGAAS